MTTVAFPTLARDAPSDYSFGQRSNVLVHTSLLNGSSQTVELPGARWVLSAEFANLVDPDAGLLEAFLAKLRGQANRFTTWDWRRPEPKGTYRGTLVTFGTIAVGATSATINGGNAGGTLLAGDKLKLGSELKIVVENATADGAGQIQVTVEAPFRAQLTGGSGVTWLRPTALFMLTASEWRARSVPGGGSKRPASFAFDAVEVFA